MRRADGPGVRARGQGPLDQGRDVVRRRAAEALVGTQDPRRSPSRNPDLALSTLPLPRKLRARMTDLTVNGHPVRFELDPQTPLLWALRDAANLTGTKYGCGAGDC